MSSEHQQEILQLRDRNLSPKQIARQLGLRPSEVSAILKTHAEQLTQDRGTRRELAPLHHCLINEGAAQVLLDSLQSRKSKSSHDFDEGMAQIFVTRLERNALIVGSYLVDYWCLGVKDCFGPRKMDSRKYQMIVQHSYGAFEQGSREITFEQAQSIIWGGVDYAASLGLSPHRDFEAAKTHLGERPESLLPIQFGKEGKPFYVSGPYDQPKLIISKLRDRVGEGNFDFLIQA